MANAQSALHHATLLSQYAQDWRPPEADYYVVPDLFPVVPVTKEFDDYARFNASTWRQTANAVVGPAGDVSRVGWYRDADGSYKAKPYALEGVIDHKERDGSDDVVQYEKRTLDVPLVTLANTLEVDGITAALTTGDLGSSYETVATDEKFDAIGSMNSNPVLYIERKARRIKRITGRKVNMIVMDDLTWQAIKWHPTSQQFLPVHTMPAGLQLLTPEILEEKLAEVVEKGAFKITNFRRENGRPPITTGSEDLRSVIKGSIIIARVEKSPSQADWSAFKCFSWTGAQDPLTGAALKDGDPSAPMGVYTYPKPEIGQRGSTVARVICNRVYKVGRTESLWVAFDAVDTTDTALYGNELT
jgi:hypothetical protein